MTDQRPLAEPKAIAEFLGTTPQQLAQYRYLGKGPKFVKVGKRVRYRWADVEAWLDENTRASTGAA
ncbi:helix-turn-helix transcriptional regulator [Nocardia farcinica]|uniref:helix-turn-helix transcriptional regulator n=1 Tax=Nocardia farcinica TaxID=37329 RepID=UPI000BF549FC|nr:helix-turn-helix domain-containing protein [Nocardia farcinica]PFW99803.1 hypothetical protein CJ469_05075 [Nocardia farcinica]PFX02548.1 hypothetical protein CJ468_05941 [Nocardia farcinica]